MTASGDFPFVGLFLQVMPFTLGIGQSFDSVSVSKTLISGANFNSLNDIGCV